MERPGRTGYFTDLAEVQSALGLPLLGRLDAEPKFYQLQEVLSRLTPDPHFSERLYRLIDRRPLRAWVVGLGGAGEETPVAAGLAERAAIALGGPVLLARLDDASPEPAQRSGLLAVAVPEFATALKKIFPGGCGARPSGIHNVFRVWGAVPGDGEPIRPAGFVLAGGPSAEQLPDRDDVDPVILVVPFRDEPRDRILADVEQLRANGHAMAGFVAIGPLGTANGQWDSPRSDSVEAAKPISGTAGGRAEWVPRERVEVSRSWSELFGPHRRRSRRRRIAWVILLIAILGAVAIVIIQSRSRAPKPAGLSPATPESSASRAAEAAPAEASERLVKAQEEPDPAAAPATDSLAAMPSPDSVTPIPATGSPAVAPAADFVTEMPAPDSMTAAREADSLPATPSGTFGEILAPGPRDSSVVVEESGSASSIRDMVPTYAGPFAVLCGSYQRGEGAAREVERLTGLGVEASVFEIRLPGKGVWHRVIAGHDLSADDARDLAVKLLESESVAAARVIAANGWGKPLPDPVPTQ